MKVYDNTFGLNEWYVLSGMTLGILLLFLLPRRFSRKNTAVFYLTGVYSGFFFDHFISLKPFNFYDMNDASRYQVMDFMSYLGYGTVSYLFFYLYHRLGVQARWSPLYVLAWSLASLCLEWIGILVGQFHYLNGYTIAYSFPFYLVVQSVWIWLYLRIQNTTDRDAAAIDSMNSADRPLRRPSCNPVFKPLGQETDADNHGGNNGDRQ